MALTKIQLDEFNALLEKWRLELKGSQNDSLQHMQEEQGVYADPNDQASIESERDFDIRIKDRERRLIRKIDQAINRIKQGEFGVCDRCGNDISPKRLEARLVTTCCIECKTEQEQGERTHI